MKDTTKIDMPQSGSIDVKSRETRMQRKAKKREMADTKVTVTEVGQT